MQSCRPHLARAWLAAAALAFAPALAVAGAAPDPKPRAALPAPPGASGVFVDRAGGRHEWRVNPAFALLWEGAPYLPAGMVVTPQSLAEPGKAEAWDADVATLRTLKGAGIQDILVQPGRPAPGIPAPAWQRLIDALEAEGFRYGVALPAAAPRPAPGHYVRSGAFRLGPVEGGGEHSLEIRIPGLGGGRIERVAASVLDRKTGRLLAVEWPKLEPIPGGVKATLSLKDPPEGAYSVEMIPLVYGLPGIPDLWDGFDDTRDSLLPLAQVKFGPGLRFFVHPLAGMIDMDGSAGYLVPNSGAYRMGFEAFLTRKYRKVETLRSQWAFRAGPPESMEVAARLVPLAVATARDSQVGYLIDEKTGRLYAIEPGQSRLWHDHLYYREHSLRESLNQLAQLLNDQVASVPVVMQRSGDLRYYHINNRQAGGLAGIGVRAAAAGLHHEVGFAVGEALLASNRPWCVALSLEGYETKEALADAFETMRRVGIKGGFVAADARAPQELPSWVAACRAGMEAKPGAADQVPPFLFFPHSVRESGGFARQHPPVDVEPRELAGGVWWVPTLAGWDPVDMGPDLRAYGITTPTGYEVHLWSPKGKQRVHLRTPAYDPVEVRTPAGKVAAKPKKRELRLELGEEPLVVRGMRAEQIVPAEVARAEMAEFERLVTEAGLKGHSVRPFQNTLALARTLDPGKDPRGVRQLLREPLAAIRRLSTQEPAAARPTQPAARKE